MAKNDKLINSLREIAARNRAMNVMAASERDTPAIYAAIAIAIYRLLDMPDEEKAEAINSIFVESQMIWENAVEQNIDIQTLCEQETGIDIRGKGR